MLRPSCCWLRALFPSLGLPIEGPQLSLATGPDNDLDGTLDGGKNCPYEQNPGQGDKQLGRGRRSVNLR